MGGAVVGKENTERKNAPAAILETAARLFTQKGVHGTSLNDIADAAGMSKGTLYYHYPAKETLVNDIADACLARSTDAVFQWMGGIGRETPLREAYFSLLHALTQDEAHSLLHVVLCAEAATGNEPLAQKLSDAYRAWEVTLELGLLRANLQNQDALAVLRRARMFFTLLDGYRLQSGGSLSGAALYGIADFLARE